MYQISEPPHQTFANFDALKLQLADYVKSSIE